MDESVVEIILNIYKIRHSVHIEKAVKDEIVFEIAQCKEAFFAMQGFTNGIKNFGRDSSTETSEISSQPIDSSGSNNLIQDSLSTKNTG